MKICKSFLCLILALVMSVALLNGCSSQNDNSQDSSASYSSEEPVKEWGASDNTGFSYSDGIDENGFFEGITAKDYVNGFDYKALSIPSRVHQISEDKLQAEINNILANYTSGEQITNRAVADGDTVNIDYVGSVDGVAFDGGSTGGAGTDVTIGVTSYIDDFLEQLIGHMPGETINVEVTFPDVYQEETLQGKDATFVTTINYIEETVQPELTDAFIEKNLSASHGWKTVDELKKDTSEQLQKDAIQNYVNEYIVNTVEVGSIPDKLMQYQEKAMLQYYMDVAESYGMELEDFLQNYVGVSGTDELIENNRASNLQNATYTLVVQSVAEDANISVSQDDMINYFDDYSEYEEHYGLPYLKQIVLFQKAVDYISDNAVLE